MFLYAFCNYVQICMYDLEDFHSIVLARQEENLDCEVKIKENFALSISILFGSLHSLLLEKVE